MAKISLDLIADASTILNSTEASTESLKELAAQGKVTSDSLKADFEAAGKSTEEFNTAIDETIKQLTAEGKVIEALILKYGSATAAQKAVTKELATMAVAGQRGTKEFNELSKAAAHLQDTIQDTRGEIKKMASDTGTFDKLAEGGRAVAAGFSLAAGASALFGKENEDLQKTIAKAQGGLALLTGAQELARIATEKGGLATGIATAAQEFYTFAIGSSTGALKLFRVALLGTGIGALILLIYEAADAFGFFGGEIDKNTEKAKENKKAIDDLADSYDGLGRKSIDTDQVIGRIKSGMDISTISTKELKAAMAELQEQLDKMQSERKILGIPGSQFFKDSSEAAKAETKDLLENIKTIKSEIEAREKLNSVIEKKVKRVRAEIIDLSGLRASFTDIVNDIIKGRQGSVESREQLIITTGIVLNTPQEEIEAALDRLHKDVQGQIDSKGLPNVKIDVKADLNILSEQQQANLEKFIQISNGVKDVLSNVASAFKSVTDIEVAKNQELIDSLNKRIEAQEKLVEREQDLQKRGLANSVASEKKRLDALHKQQEQAIQKQEELARKRQAIDAALQSVSLITASAQIINSVSSAGPVGLAIAAATIAAMFAAFVAAQVKASELTNSQGFRKGGYTGDGDPSEVSTAIGNRGYKYHRREFVFDEEKTAKHRNFFEALHKDDKLGIIYGMKDLLQDTGVSLPDADLPRKLHSSKAEYEAIKQSRENEELRLMREKLESIELELKDWKERPKEETFSHGDTIVKRKGNRTVIKTTRKND